MEEVYGEASYRFFKYYGLLSNVFPETSKYLTQRIIAFISHRELEGVSTPASRKQWRAIHVAVGKTVHAEPGIFRGWKAVSVGKSVSNTNTWIWVWIHSTHVKCQVLPCTYNPNTVRDRDRGNHWDLLAASLNPGSIATYFSLYRVMWLRTNRKYKNEEARKRPLWFFLNYISMPCLKQAQ